MDSNTAPLTEVKRLRELQELLRTARADLAADNREAARVEEARMESLLKGYIENTGKIYRFGGIHNLLGTIAKIMEEKSQCAGDDFEKAAQAIDECASECDLRYAKYEHPFSGSCGGD